MICAGFDRADILRSRMAEHDGGVGCGGNAASAGRRRPIVR
jgi:hypothetical protein